MGSWGPAVGGRGGKARSLGVDREDRSARKRREAEGEGVSRAGGKREGASRAGARARRRGEGGARGRELPKGEGRAAAAAWSSRKLGREERVKMDRVPLVFRVGKGQRALTRAKDLGVSGSLAAVEAAGRGRSTMSV